MLLSAGKRLGMLQAGTSNIPMGEGSRIPLDLYKALGIMLRVHNK